MTLTGYLLLPLSLLAILLPWRYAFLFLFLTSGLSDAAIINFAGIGIQPGYLFLLLVVFRIVLEMLAHDEFVKRSLLYRMFALVVFVLSSSLALFTASLIFTGSVDVVTGKDGLQLSLARPYTQLRMENIAQLSYIILNAAGVFCIAHKLGRMQPGTAASTVHRSIIAFTLGADIFFHSNVGYIAAFGQSYEYGIRVSGPFAEPSALAYYFAGCVFYLAAMLRRDRDFLSTLALTVAIIALILSTSTSAYIVVAVFLTLTVVQGLRLWRRQYVQRRTKVRDLAFILFIAIVMLGSVALAVERWQVIVDVIDEFVLNKGDTNSFSDRSGVDAMAVDVFIQTWGIGLGLGSHKPNSLAMTLLSNTGIVGTVSFAALMYSALAWKSGASVRDEFHNATIWALRWFVIGLLIVHGFANPNLNVCTFWVAIGFLLGISSIDDREDTGAVRQSEMRRRLLGAEGV
jgi:hypothetical protein